LKKTTLLMIASASMLLAAPSANTTTAINNAPQKGMYVITKGQGGGMDMKHCKCKMSQKGQGVQGKQMRKKMMMRQKMKMNSPFLIKHGLPHLTRMIMPYMNDPAFNLTPEQKYQLAKVRKATMSAIIEAKPKVSTLRKEIIQASQTGVSADKLKDKVAELAVLEAAATMAHLKCIESTKAILTKDQMYFLLTNKNRKMNHGKKQMMRGNSHPKKMMKMNRPQHMVKCASGKCGQGMGK